MKAIVVFTDDGIAFRRFLKPGFRHVFICVASDGDWICIDVAGWIPVFINIAPEEVDLAEIYREMGYTVIETETSSKPVKFPFMMRDCVGLVKSVLSINNFAITPYGLYRRLKNDRRWKKWW